jgi:hypothetical protein
MNIVIVTNMQIVNSIRSCHLTAVVALLHTKFLGGVEYVVIHWGIQTLTWHGSSKFHISAIITQCLCVKGKFVRIRAMKPHMVSRIIDTLVVMVLMFLIPNLISLLLLLSLLLLVLILLLFFPVLCSFLTPKCSVEVHYWCLIEL